MALTPEQEAQIEFQTASSAASNEAQRQLDVDRRTHELELESRRARLELLKTAKEVLIENKRNLPVSEREVSDSDITTFATSLESFLIK